MMGVSLLQMAYRNDECREPGTLFISAFIGTGVTVWGLKEIFGLKRPLDDVLESPAFPSGHTTSVFTSATLLGSRYPKLRSPLYIGAGLVGVSRIYLGRHYVSDIIAGVAIATVIGVLVSRNRPTLLEWRF